MEMDTKCVLCNRLDEDGTHLFFKCKGAVKVWRALGMEQHRRILERKSSASDAMKYILGTQEREQMIIVTFLWLWWLERNRYAAEYLAICKQNSKPAQVVKQMWKRPDRGWLKINSEGAFSERTSEGGWGVIIRDEEGDVVEAAAGKLTRLWNDYIV
ncbi:hypothetical protein PVAP13_3NG139801 [Panicum virgatum]|uniref:Reverse transcriptase zinc-binding domain-containing protein n=1 Tax=Panicum virgatum TaxID=38727 RepID=A0A8T0UCN1_PANVG|nr:hypothetical protein PVAP13_3NG139801 [Panicum virgatum]